MKRILVVDDDLQNRKQHYANALIPEYDVIYTDESDLVYDVIKNNKVDLYLVDLNLDGFTDPRTNDSLSVINILVEIGMSKPIILLSGTYEQLMQKGKLTPIIQNAAEKGYNVGSFITWEEILKAGQDKTNNRRSALHSRIEFIMSTDRRPYDFGIVCALESELEPFMKKIPQETITTVCSDNRYREAKLETKTGRILRFVVATSDYMGSVDAAILTTEMAVRFNVDTIFMIGVCGGREKVGVKIGDVIIPHDSVAYQRGKLTNQGFLPEINFSKPKEKGFVKYSNADEILAGLFKEYVTELLDKQGKTFTLDKPSVRYDMMACADYVIDKEDELDKIADQCAQRKLCAVDMESYGVYRVGEMLDIKTLVIKSVMDLTNNKSDAYKPYASFMASNYLYQLINREIIKFPV